MHQLPNTLGIQIQGTAIVFWSLQLLSGQIIAATHDVASDRKGGKRTSLDLRCVVIF